MMVMMVSCVGMEFYMAVLFVAVLVLPFQFQGRVTDAMFPKLFPHGMLDFVGITIGNDMHCGIVVAAVQTPNMDMVNIQDTAYCHEVRFDFPDIHIVRCFFQE